MRNPNCPDAKSTVQLIYQKLSRLSDGKIRTWSVKIKSASTATCQQIEPLTRNWHLVCMHSSSGYRKVEGNGSQETYEIVRMTNRYGECTINWLQGCYTPVSTSINTTTWIRFSDNSDNTSSQLPFCSSSWNRMNLKVRLLNMNFITRAWSATHTTAWWHSLWIITIGMRRASRKMSISTILKPCRFNGRHLNASSCIICIIDAY